VNSDGRDCYLYIIVYADRLFRHYPSGKKRERKLLYVYLAIFAATLSVHVLNGMDVFIQSPAELIKIIISKIIHVKSGSSL
jgi:hypothetical protein